MTDGEKVGLLAEKLIEKLDVTLLEAGILSALHYGLSRDSRTCAKHMEVGHALVIRECVALSSDRNLIRIDRTDQRTQRVFYSFTDAGREAIHKAIQWPTT